MVLGFWTMQESFSGLGTLLRQAGFWTAVRLLPRQARLTRARLQALDA